MAGITGWIDFERDVARDVDTVRAMTATLASRGPDGEELWASPRAVLGHRRLALRPGADDRQPLVVEHDGRTLAAITFNGEIYNAGALRRELEARGHRFRTRGDAEVIARAFLEYGEDAVARLDGMFAFGLWDPQRQELLLARDRLGNKPLLYWPYPTGVLFASEHKALLAHPFVSPTVDADGLREVLSQAGTPDHGVFAGMRKLAPGQLARIGRGGVTVRRYWALPPGDHPDDLDTTVATVRELLEASVAAQLDSDVEIGSLVSGGLDSSVVTALAARELALRGDGPVRTFTVDFVDHAEHFRPDKVRSTLDAPFVEALVRHVGADHTTVLVDTADLVDPVVADAALRARDLPTPLGDMHPALYLLCRGVREHVPAALMGEIADALFGGFTWVHDPELVAADTFPWIAIAQRYIGPQGLGNGLLAPDLQTKLDVPGYCRDRFSEALAEVPEGGPDDPVEQRMRQLCYVHLSRYPETLLPNDDRLGSAVGLELRTPFCDHRLVEYVFNAPWSLKTFDGREKSLLRAAARDLLPDTLLDRQKSPFPVTQDPRYARALRGALAEVLADPGAPVAPLLDMQAAQQVVAADDDGAAAWRGRTNIEMVLQLNAWLSTYGIRLAL